MIRGVVEMCNIDKVFDDISKLEYNWNGYEAEPFKQEFLDSCKTLIKQLIVEPKIFPTGRDSIQIEYEGKNGYLEFEIFEDKIGALLVRPNGRHLSFTILSLHSETLNVFIEEFFDM